MEGPFALRKCKYEESNDEYEEYGSNGYACNGARSKTR